MGHAYSLKVTMTWLQAQALNLKERYTYQSISFAF